MTREGYEKLKKELVRLKSVERPRLVREIEDARSHGDLSENAEYHAAKDRMGHVKGRILDLEQRISKAEIIDPVAMKGEDKVMFGARITLLDVEADKKITYQIVGEHESDISSGLVSVNAPIARALIGKKKDDTVSVRTPRGVKEFEILEVEYE